jgi:hypothetical protein
VLRSTATTEPLTPPWLLDYQARVDPQLTPIQKLACEAVWAWFDELWEAEQVDSSRLRDLQGQVLAFFQRIETSGGRERDAAIVELVERLRAVDIAVFFPR